MNGYGQLKVLATLPGESLAAEVCKHLLIKPWPVEIKRHNDGEVEPRILDDVRDSDVFIIAPLHPQDDNLIQTVLVAEAARASSAKRVTLVIPYMGYARSDRKSASRMSVGIRMIIKMLETAKPNRMLILDIHAEQSLSIADNPIVDHLFGSAVLEPELRKHFGQDVVIATPDIGGSQRASKYANWLSSDMVIVYKQRSKPGEVDTSRSKVIGDVAGKDVVFVDDILDTGGTMIAGAKTVKASGAKSVSVCVTHGLFSNNALDKIQDCGDIDRVFVTNSVNHDYDKLCEQYDKLTVVSVARLLAEAIRRTHDSQSVSSLIL